jgi:hypothetical protein
MNWKQKFNNMLSRVRSSGVIVLAVFSSTCFEVTTDTFRTGDDQVTPGTAEE